MSESVTAHDNAKRSRTNDDDTNGGSAAIGGSATKPNAGTSKQVPMTKSALQAALESQKLGIVSLPSISLPYLTPIMEKVLRDHAIHYYAVEKLKDMKSTVNYVSPAARKVNMLLQNDSGAAESEVFKTLHSKFTARLEEFRVELTRDYVLPSYDPTEGFASTTIPPFTLHT